MDVDGENAIALIICTSGSTGLSKGFDKIFFHIATPQGFLSGILWANLIVF